MRSLLSRAAEPPDSAEASRSIRRVTWIGLIANLVLGSVKVTAGAVGHSQAVLADGVHSFTDLVTDIAILVGVRYWTAPADRNHPHGHRRIETLVTVGIGISLTLVAVGVGIRALRGLAVHSAVTPAPLALAAALLSIVVKEVLYHWNAALGRRIGSRALTANAWHHRSDALSSLPAAAAVGLSLAEPRLAFVDAVGAVVVCVLILQAAWKIITPAASELVDQGAPPPVVQALEHLARSVDGVQDVHDVRTRYSASELSIDLHIVVDGSIPVREGHAIAEQVRKTLCNEGPDVRDVVVHVDPGQPPHS